MQNREVGQGTWVEVWARRIETLGLSPVVLSLMDLVHALGLVGSQALLMVQPLTTGLVSNATIERAITLLEDPALQARLRSHLERGEEEV